MEDEVTNDWSRDKARKSEKVWNGIDVLVRCELRKDLQQRFSWFEGPRAEKKDVLASPHVIITSRP